MSVYREEITGLMSKGTSPTYINITEQVREVISRSGIKEGIVTVISPHTTCSVFFEEYVHDTMPNGKEFIQQDLDNVLEKIIPNQTAWGQYFYPGLKHFEEVETWPIELVFISCLGLNSKSITRQRVLRYLRLYPKYNMTISKVEKIVDNINR